MEEGKYFTFTIAPGANYSLSFTAITASAFASATGPDRVRWGYSRGGVSSGLGSDVTPTTSGNGPAVTATLTDTNITTATEFRFVGFREELGARVAGTFRITTPTLTGTATLRSAGTLTWDGGRGDGNWNSYDAFEADQSNWNSNHLPTAALVDALHFAGNSQTTTNNNIDDLTVGSVTFDSGAASFTLNGNAVTLEGGISNQSGATQTYDLDTTLSTGAHSFDAAAGNIVITSTLSGTGAITKLGGHTVALNNANTYSGGTAIHAGTLIANHDNALGAASVSIANGATLLQASSTTLTNDITVASGGTLSTTGTLAGTTTLAEGSLLTTGATPGIINNDGTLIFDGAATYTWRLDSLTDLSIQAGVGFDQINNTGTLQLDGGLLALTLGSNAPSLDAFWSTNRSWSVVKSEGSGSIVGTALGLDLDQSAWSERGSFTLFINASVVALNWTAAPAIPEPSTYAAIVGGVALASALAYRRRTQRPIAASRLS
jgi:autotransporter-associated beta strand protein